MLSGNKIIISVLFCFFLTLCIGSLFLASPAFVDSETTPKWYCVLFGGIAFVLAYIISSFFVRNTTEDTDRMLFCFYVVIALVCTAQAFYGIFQYAGFLPASKGFRVTGSFDNPAGFAAGLCTGFPFLLVFLAYKKVWIKILVVAAGLILIVAVALSASRAGILSLFTVGMLALFYKFRIKTNRKILVFVALLISLSGLYFLKKDSADGRILIWCCTWEMMQDKPLLGHGTEGFKANYMDYQAGYFEKYPDSKFLMLADNVKHPFNEYWLLLTNYGMAGFGLFCLFVWFLWKSYRRNQNKSLFIRSSGWCLLSVAVFALFSYPSRYPFTWVMVIMSTIVVIREAGYKVKAPPACAFSFRIMLIPLLITFAAATYIDMSAEIRWSKTARKSMLGQTRQMLSEYESLYPYMKRKPLFLYNYAAELNYIGRYHESSAILAECAATFNDYDVQLLFADNYHQTGKYPEAEQHYQRASYMCPNRFMPLYHLAKLYAETKRPKEAMTVAKRIMEKEIKIPSGSIYNIKKEMEELINNNNMDSINISASESRVSKAGF